MVDFPIKNGDFPQLCKRLPEGNDNPHGLECGSPRDNKNHPISLSPTRNIQRAQNL